MTDEEFERIKYAAGKAYKSLREKDYSTAYSYLWMLNYRLGLIEGSKEKFGN